MLPVVAETFLFFYLHLSCVLFQGPLVGMNPVQIRATVDLYPSSRPSLGGGIHHPEAPVGWCLVNLAAAATFTILTNSLCKQSHRGICWQDHFAKTSAWIAPLCFTATTKTQSCRLMEWIREIRLNLITLQTKMAVECRGWCVVV